MSLTDTPGQTEFVEVEGNPVPDGAEVVWFEGTGGRNLRACLVPARTPEAARGTAIVCPGRSEFIEKYFEVAEDLLARGFAVLILDWPGQGLSDRLLPDRDKGHIDRFETFMGALRNGLAKVEDRLPRPYVCVAHSMGGAIAFAAIVESLVKVDAAAFCAPMWGIKQRIFGMRYLVWAMRVMGRSNDYVQQPGPPETFETNIVTHDRKRWQMNRDLVDASPDLFLGPVTWGWLGASLQIFAVFAKASKIRRLELPVLIATAEEEKLVENESHERIATLLPACEHITVEGARHEILMETDDKRNQFWDAFDRLLERARI
ncbi:MAG: alpha/beta hydrolase [Pseudomonadota bacterium]